MPPKKTIPLFDLLSRTDPNTSGLPRVGADRHGPRTPPGVVVRPPVAAPAPRVVVAPPKPASTTPPKPTVTVELKPAPAFASDPDASPAASSHEAQPSGKLRTFALPGLSPALVPAFVVVGLLAAIILTWLIAYNRGASNKQKELEPILQSSRPSILEPSPANTTPPVAILGPQANTPPSNSQPQTTTTGARPTALGVLFDPAILELKPPASAAIMHASGWKTAEIRETGMNYLNIATLPAKDAAGAIQYLAENGVEAFAVPLASKVRSVNTSSPSTYRVFVLPGITSEQYRSKQSVKTNLEATIARVGRSWAKERRGPSDFRDPLWTKFDEK